MRELRNPFLIISIILSLFIGSATLTRGHQWGDDFASYIMQAKSILNGDMQEFVTHNAVTIFQSSSQIGPVAYPWGYPLILTPVYVLRGLSPLAFKLPGLFFFVGFLICLYFLIRARLTVTECLLIVSLFAFNPTLLGFLDQIVSDIPFLFFATLGLFLMTSEANRNYFLLALVFFAAFFIRTPGILLLAAFLADQSLKAWIFRSDRELAKKVIQDTLIVIFGFGLLWLISIMLFPSGQESYFAQYSAFTFDKVFGSIIAYFNLFGLFFGQGSNWRWVYYLLFACFVVGMWMRRNDDRLFIWFFALWMISLITWPYWQGPRFIFPVLPLFIYFAFQGIKFALHYLPENRQKLGLYISYAFWLFITTVFIFNSAGTAYANLKNQRKINGPFDPYSIETYNFVKENTSENSIIIFFKPRAMRMMTDRNTLMINTCEQIAKGDYIVLSKKVGENNQIPPERIGECNLPIKTVFENRRFIIYQFLR